MPKLPEGWTRYKHTNWSGAWWEVKYAHRPSNSRLYTMEGGEFHLYWTDHDGRQWRVKTDTLEDAFKVFEMFGPKTPTKTIVIKTHVTVHALAYGQTACCKFVGELAEGDKWIRFSEWADFDGGPGIVKCDICGEGVKREAI